MSYGPRASNESLLLDDTPLGRPSFVARHSRAIRIGLAWGAVFLILVFTLPRFPEHRLIPLEPLRLYGMAGRHTLVAIPSDEGARTLSTAACVNLLTGQVRTVRFPGLAYRSEFFLSGESLAVLCREPASDRTTVVAWDASTATEIFRREFPQSVAAPRDGGILVQSDDDTQPPVLTSIELPSGREETRAFRTRRRSGRLVSPDGRFESDVVRSPLRIRDTRTGDLILETEAILAAFSADSQYLATLAARSRNPTSVATTCRVYDLRTRAIVAELEDAEQSAISLPDILEFQEDDRTLVTFRYADRGRVGSTRFWRWIDDSEAHAEERRLLRAFRVDGTEATFSHFASRSSEMPSLYLEGGRASNMITRRLHRHLPKTASVRLYSPTGRYGVITLQNQEFMDQLQNLLARIPGLGVFSPTRFKTYEVPRVWDFDTGRAILTPSLAREMQFTTDGEWLIVNGTPERRPLEIWRLPPRVPWGWSFFLSLLVPVIARTSAPKLFVRWCRRFRKGL